MMNRKMMMDRAGRAMGGRGMNADRMGRAMADRMGGGMRMQPPTPVNRPVPDELVYKKGGPVKGSKAMMKKEAGMKKGVKKMMGGGMPGYKHGGKVHSSASKRADGIAVRGKTKGKMMRMGGICK